MKIILLIVLLLSTTYGRKSFTADYFVKKDSLHLPVVTKELLDISKHTHKSHTMRYTYVGKTSNIDSVYSYLDLQAFPPNMEYKKYHYAHDSVFISSVSINQRNGDTTTLYDDTYTENGLKKIAFDKMTKCSTFVTYQKWGKRKREVSKCPGEYEPAGQVFDLVEHGEYIDEIETRRGKVDSSDIRRFYLSSFDSLVAEYMVIDSAHSIPVNLYYFNAHKKVINKFSFGTISENFKVTNFEKYTYTPNGKIYRIYFCKTVDRLDLKKGYKLVNYTEYEYDKLGRLTTMTTRVPPDPKYQKKDNAE